MGFCPLREVEKQNLLHPEAFQPDYRRLLHSFIQQGSD